MSAVATVTGSSGARQIPVSELYTGPGETVLTDGEVIESVRVPALPARSGVAYEKLNRSSGDFAMVSAAAHLGYDPSGRISVAHVVLGAVAPTPWVVSEAQKVLIGSQTDEAIAQAARGWVRHAHPLSGNAWKVDAAVTLLERVLHRAAAQAKGSSS
jgi:CO/xanthine dehydrogenase FAD-binding subunit